MIYCIFIISDYLEEELKTSAQCQTHTEERVVNNKNKLAVAKIRLELNKQLFKNEINHSERIKRDKLLLCEKDVGEIYDRSGL